MREMEEVLKAIAEAEKEAARIKEEATKRADDIVRQAETDAVLLFRATEDECKSVRKSSLKEAEERAQKDYDAAIEESYRSARTACDAVLERTEQVVAEIVRRISQGDC